MYFTGISSPEKSYNNTRKKISFFRVRLISPVSRWLAYRATWPGWWMHGEAFTIVNQGRLSEFFRIMAAKKSVSLTESDVKIFLEGEENQNSRLNLVQ